MHKYALWIEIYDLCLLTFFAIEFNWCTIFLFWLAIARRKIFNYILYQRHINPLESNYKTYSALTYRPLDGRNVTHRWIANE